MNTTNTNNMTSATIINGRVKDMSLGKIISEFTELLISNDSRESMPIRKEDYYTRVIWNIIRKADCSKMTICDCHGNVLSMTSDIDIMFMILAYYNAWIEDSFTNEHGTGFCWRTEDDEWYSAVFA